MRKAFFALPLLALFAGCAGVGDTILSGIDKAEGYTQEAVTRSIEGAKVYCKTVPENKRMELREATNVSGKGPVVVVNCENL